MKKFFNDDLLLENKSAKKIYKEIKDLPIIDYHCHLDEKKIKEDKKFENLYGLCLKEDHYKWRVMRLCGVDEEYITGSKSFKEKFFKFCEIMPKLIGNPVYFWAHMELKQIFNITLPICLDNAEYIWTETERQLKDLSTRTLLKKFNVEYVATTDDPLKELVYHGEIDGVKVCPTFRPDACLNRGVDKNTLEERLQYFISKGCKILDYGFDFIKEDDGNLFWLIKIAKKYDLILQLHFGTFRNVNEKAFNTIGVDSGFDIMRYNIDVDALVKIFNKANSELSGLPNIILYPLNDNFIKPLATMCGAFRKVIIGSAWWFNDNVSGIKNQMQVVSEYSVFGTQLGMLTDSRSFSSYVRFDFYRRILASFIGEKIEKGEYDYNFGINLAKDISYLNIKNLLKI